MPGMANLFKPRYSVPLPNGERETRTSKIFWGQYRTPGGKLVRVSLGTPNKAAAQLKLAELVRDAAAGRDVDRKTLVEHAEDWRAAMRGRGLVAPHVNLQANRILRVAAACGWAVLADMDGGRAEQYLAGLDRSAKTRNDIADCLKAFATWCVRGKRLAATPFADLPHVNIATDRRHDRRAFTQDEMGRLLATTRAVGRRWRTLTAGDRYMLYLLAASTGFRAGELAELTPALFQLDVIPPVVQLPARDDKARRAVRQPLPASILPEVRAWLRGRQPHDKLWPGSWREEPIKMLRLDLADAGIEYRVDGPDGPLFVDFVAFRHFFIASLDRPGITLKQAMELARHRDPRLTCRVYGKAQLQELGAAVDLALNLAPAPRTPAQLVSSSREPDGPPTPPAGANGIQIWDAGQAAGNEAPPDDTPPGTFPGCSSLFVVILAALALNLALDQPAADDRQAA
jgi:integrase